MKRGPLNYVIDFVSFCILTGLALTGFVMQFRLPPGSGRFLSMFGLNRHQWGEIHSWLAAALLIVLAVHLVLHWRFIYAMVTGRGEGSDRRGLIGLLTLVTLAALVAMVILGPVRERDSGYGRGDGGGRERKQQKRLHRE